MKNEKLLDSILEFVETYLNKNKKYDEINSVIKKNVGGDFYPYLDMCDHILFDKFLDVIETLLQSDIVTYFIFDCQHMKDGGFVEIPEEEKKYVLKTIEDLKNYLINEIEIFKD